MQQLKQWLAMLRVNVAITVIIWFSAWSALLLVPQGRVIIQDRALTQDIGLIQDSALISFLRNYQNKTRMFIKMEQKQKL